MTNGLRLRAAGVQLIALAALVVLAGVARERLPLDPLYSLKAAAAFAVIAALVIAFIDTGTHPFAQFGPANGVTLGRATFVALVAALIGERTEPFLASVAASAALAVTLSPLLPLKVPLRLKLVGRSSGRVEGLVGSVPTRLKRWAAREALPTKL